MKRGFSQYLLLLGICACLLLSACGKKVLIGTPPQTAFPPAAASETQAFSSMPPGLDSQTTGSLSDEEQRMVDAYLVIFDWIYQEDPALNTEIKKIAVDTAGMQNLTTPAKEALFAGLESYGCELLDKSYAQLKEEGYLTVEESGRPGGFVDGILVSIEDEPYTDGKIRFNVEKWRGPLGAVMFHGNLIAWDGNAWQVTEKRDMMMA